MPAAKMFLTSADIAAVTGLSLRASQYMLAMFAARGQTLRCGESSRGQMVDVSILCRYLCEQDGADYAERKAAMNQSLKELGSGRHRKRK